MDSANSFKNVETQTVTMQKELVREIIEAGPFVKWAGGKTQLLKALLEKAPKEFEGYFEPFLGGGAFFFKLASLGRIKKAHLNDCNSELVNAYKIVKENPNELLEELSSGKYENQLELFYKIRAETPTSPVAAAARFIFLNKTAFNGLYRVNSKGGFNVPFGKYSNPKIADKATIFSASKALQYDEISCLDFEEAVANAQKKDFVYFDPPYVPLSKTSRFTQYTPGSFSEKDQERLFNCFKRLDKKGCFVMLSNSDSPLVEELYKEYNTGIVMAGRAINCKAMGRGKIKEALITNYL